MFSPATHGTRGTRVSPSCAGDIPRKSMRVKILYTFDFGKTNCLVRPQELFSIPTIPLSPNNVVGMIELSSVVRAVVNASPEAIGKLGIDYTVYSTDFSEDQSPFVGHGRLSNLTGHCKQPTMITGRVSHNILGMFSRDGNAETLEVNIRLVPFSTLDEGLDNAWIFQSTDISEHHSQPSHSHTSHSHHSQPPHQSYRHHDNHHLPSQLNTDPVQDPAQDPAQDQSLVNIPSSPPPFLHEQTPSPSSPVQRPSPKRPRLSHIQTDSGYTSDVWNTDNIPPTDFPPTDLPSDGAFAAPRPFRRPHTFTLPPRAPTLDELRTTWNKFPGQVESPDHQSNPHLQRSQSLSASTAQPQAPSLPTKSQAPLQASQQESNQPHPTTEVQQQPSLPTYPESHTPVAPPSQSRPDTPASRPDTPFNDQQRPSRSDSRRGSMSAMSPDATAMELSRSQSHSRWEPKASELIYEPGATGIPQPRSGSGAKRRRAIEEHLKTCLDAGEMPPFCHNCGEIRTPTWRKIYGKDLDGDPSEVSLTQEEQKDLMGTQVLAHENEKPTRFRIMKKSLNAHDQQDKSYHEIKLCNPCGLYFHKKGTMRPESKWSNKAPTTRQRKLKPHDAFSDLPVIYTDPLAPEPQALQPSNIFTDPVQPAPERNTTYKPHPSSNQDHQALPTSFQGMVHVEPNAKNYKRRASSTVDAAPSSKRQRGSSGQPQPPPLTHSKSAPPPLVENPQQNKTQCREAASSTEIIVKDEPQERSIVEIDLTSPVRAPKPMSRLLFPSPRKAGEFKSLDDNHTSSNQASPTPRSNDAPMIQVRADTPEKEVSENNSSQGAGSTSGDSGRTPLSSTTLNHGRGEPPKTPKTAGKDVHRTPARGAAPVETPFTQRAEAMLFELFEGSPTGFPTFDTPPKVPGDTPARGILSPKGYFDSALEQENSFSHDESTTVAIHSESAEYIVDVYGEVYDGGSPIQSRSIPGQRTPKALRGLWGTKGEWVTREARLRRERDERMQR